MRIAGLLSVGLLVITWHSGFCQDRTGQGPKDFFQNDFVNSDQRSVPQQSDTPFTLPTISLDKAMDSLKSNQGNSSSLPGFFNFGSSSSSSSQSSSDEIATDNEKEREASNFALGNGIPVESIGLIVNGLEKKHFIQCLKDLYELCERTGIHIDTVYVVGNLDSVMDPHLSAANWPKSIDDQPLLGINLYGGKIAVVEEAPKDYPVQLSPSWIVNTKDGAYILEALGGYKRYFNNRGQLVLVGSPVQ